MLLGVLLLCKTATLKIIKSLIGYLMTAHTASVFVRKFISFWCTIILSIIDLDMI